MPIIYSLILYYYYPRKWRIETLIQSTTDGYEIDFMVNLLTFTIEAFSLSH